LLAPAGSPKVCGLHWLQISNALHVPLDAATARSAEGTRSPAYSGLVVATTIPASSLAFTDGSVVNVGLPAIGRGFMRPSETGGEHRFAKREGLFANHLLLKREKAMKINDADVAELVDARDLKSLFQLKTLQKSLYFQ
jgi:hypothetical protein